MKEKIFTRIKEALGKTSLSDRTLQTKAGLVAKKVTKEDELTDEVVDDVVEELKSLEGQLNRDVAERVREQTKDKGKKSQEESDPEHPKDEGKDPSPDSELLSEVLEKLKSLEEREKRKTEAEHRSSLKKSIIDELKNNGVDDEIALKAALYDSKIDYEKSVEDNVESVRAAYDKIASTKPETQPFFGGGGVKKSEETLEAEREERKKRFLKDARI